MKIGTRSLLFGVHQFLWHPITVAIAWRKTFGFWPRAAGTWIAILVHDWGYWGKADMDGAEGTFHPEAGAYLAGRLTYLWHRLKYFRFWFTSRERWKSLLGRSSITWRGFVQADDSRATHWSMAAFQEVYFHSRRFAEKIESQQRSMLYYADKICILHEPRWFYLLRARMSGELREFMANSEYVLPRCWYSWYTGLVRRLRAEVRSIFIKKDNPGVCD